MFFKGFTLKKSLMLAVILLIYCKPSLAEKYVFAISEYYPPYEYVEDDRFQGLFVDVVRQAFAQTDHELEIRQMPWSRILKMSEEGSIDLFVAFKTAERAEFVDFSNEAFIPQTMVFFKQIDRQVDYTGDLASLSDYRIGAITDMSYGQEFDAAVTSGMLPNVELYKDGFSNFKKLMSARIDLMISDRYRGLFVFKKQGVTEKILELKPAVQEQHTHLAYSKKGNLKLLRDDLDKILFRMKQDGSFQMVIDQFFAGLK